MTKFLTTVAATALFLIQISVPLNAQRSDSDDESPFVLINDQELREFANNFILLVHKVTEQDWPFYIIVSDEMLIIDRRVNLEIVEGFFSEKLLEFLSDLEFQSDDCTIIPIRDSTSKDLEVIAFVDETTSTFAARKNCFLVSLLVAYEIELDWTLYRDDERKSLEIDILTYLAQGEAR